MVEGRRDEEDWDGGWDRGREAQEAAWAAMSPAQRLGWLEEALVLAAASGALARDRRRRARAAARWSGGREQPASSGTLPSRADEPEGPPTPTFPG